MWKLILSAIPAIVAIIGIIANISDVISFFKSLIGLIVRLFRKRIDAEYTYYFESQIGLVDSKLADYANRSIYDEHNSVIHDPIGEIKSYCNLEKGGYIYVEGKKRIGKTVLAALFVRDLKAIHHFVSVSEGRDDPDLIVKSLIEQIHKRIKKKCPDLGSNCELNAIMGSSLALLSKYGAKKKECEFIVIDGLDILENRRLDVLPEYLHKGVYIIILCDKAETENYLKRYSLHRLTYLETKAFLRNTNLSEAEINEIHNGLEGNPYSIGYLKNHFDSSQSIEYQIDDARYSLNIEKQIRRMSSDEFDLMLLLSAARASLSLSDIMDIQGIDREKVDALISEYRSYILDDKNGILLIDDEIKKAFNDDVLSTEEQEQLVLYHQRIVSHFEKKGGEYAEKYLTYHYYVLNKGDKIVAILKKDNRKAGVFEEKRRFVVSLADKTTDTFIDPIYQQIIKENDLMLWEFVFSSLKSIVDNQKDYPKVRNILKRIDDNQLTGFTRGVTDYYQAICQRKEGRIADALNLLETIPIDIMNDPYDLWVLIQQADCAREIGQVVKANSLYEKVTQIPDCREKHPQEYWESQHKIIDRKYCDGLYKQTLDLDSMAKQECKHLYMYSLLLKFYKEDAQVYNDQCMFSDTIKTIENAMEICNNTNNIGMKGELYNLLSIAECVNNPGNGRITAQTAYEINVRAASILEVGKSLIAIGNSYYYEHDYNTALEYYNKALKQFEEAKYKSGMAMAEHEISKIYYKLKENEKTLQHVAASRRYLIRDYGTTHKIYGYKNRIVECLVKNESLSEKQFVDCEKIEFIENEQTFINAYKKVVEH